MDMSKIAASAFIVGSIWLIIGLIVGTLIEAPLLVCIVIIPALVGVVSMLSYILHMIITDKF